VDHPLYRHARYLISAASLAQLPPDEGYEVAFVGRSNVGKSSALNRITSQRALARTSKTPGRTQHINVFTLDDERRLIDLPGYGYAKVPEKMKQQWQLLINDYLEQRQSLRGIILLMDCRHPLKEFDEQMLSWCHAVGMPAYVLLTKADKLSRGAAATVRQTLLQEIKKDFSPVTPRYGGAEEIVQVQLFSSLKGQGVEEAHAKLDDWLHVESDRQ
jgi:GTP-binding protein